MFGVICRHREAGVNEFILEPPRDGQWPTMERIAAEVIPGLRPDRVAARDSL